MTLGKFQYRHDAPPGTTLRRMCLLTYTLPNCRTVPNCSLHSFDTSRSRTSDALSRRREVLWMNCETSFQQTKFGFRSSSQIRPFQSFSLQQFLEKRTPSRSRRMSKSLCLGVGGLDQLKDGAHEVLDIGSSVRGLRISRRFDSEKSFQEASPSRTRSSVPLHQSGGAS